ncbi:acyltransferase [Waterburya agarophytonicola K14]|uniref:Acyltransferase n=1 Tax=Waterburya agarophytonicola KI4 TaxID=2874699 RepID=A0A964BL39_9CYAN|nr:acyltransferase [Waterburya agarophytonicola]MCC0175369.1 acyltransferase [Waterburya agarophytonicola KI4]
MIVVSPPQKKFLNSINYFRGIAIIIIVAAHSYGIANWNVYQDPTLFEKFFYALNLNGSVFFMFISGFLYNHIFYPRFNYKKFMIKKAKYVLIPYLVCSILPILYAVFIDIEGGFLLDSLKDKPTLAILWFLATGRAVYAYWYIPMIILIFAISPLINAIIKSKYLIYITLGLIPISMLVHRPIHNTNPVHSLVYFLPIYLLGIYSSINQKKIYAFLKSNQVKITILFLAIALGLIQVLIFNVHGNFSKGFWSITVPDVNLLQKILLCFLLMSVLDKYEDTDITAMKKTAETSFAIYFIHPFLLKPITKLVRSLELGIQGNILTLIVATFLVVIVSIAIAHLLKLVFKGNSRYIIGW